MNTEFKEGDKVWYSGAWGSEPRVKGIIDDVDVKNDRRVYGVVLDEGKDRDKWGYEDHFERLI